MKDQRNNMYKEIKTNTKRTRPQDADVIFAPPRDPNRMSQFLTKTEFVDTSQDTSLTACCQHFFSNFSLKKVLHSVCPITEWLPEYVPSMDLANDVIAGTTVSILGVPQSLAYALLGNVPPVVGLYMSFFPLFIYTIFGTSRHNSIGTFAIICLMIGKVVSEHETPIDPEATVYTATEIATATAFTVACFQLLMYIFNIGALTTFLSDPLIKGFTTGAAVHVCAAQIPDITGLKLPKRLGLYKILYMISDIFQAASKANLVCLGISVMCIVVLHLNNTLLKPFLAKKCKFPFPMELVLVIVFTLISGLTGMYEIYNIVIIGDIPSGLPVPSLPRFEFIPSIIVPAFTISAVSYTLTASFTKVFATKNLYEVNCNQEAFALSMCNFVGSFVSCMPVCVSISRSLVQEQVGGRTQIASCVCACFTLIVLLWAGPYFRTLPKCVLASIVLMALKNTVFQAKYLVTYWHKNKIDWLVFSSTFICVVTLDIDIGLVVGLVLSLLVLIGYTMSPYACLYGHLPDTEFYINFDNHKQARDIPYIKIFHYGGGLSFAQTEIFRNKLYKNIKLNPIAVAQARKKELRQRQLETRRPSANELESAIYLNLECLVTIKYIILDFSNVTYIDPSGVTMLSVIAKSFAVIGVDVLIAATTDPVFRMITKCTAKDELKTFLVYPTIHDAVLAAQEHLKSR